MKFKAVSILFTVCLLYIAQPSAFAGVPDPGYADPNSCFQGVISKFSMREIAGDSRRNKIKFSMRRVLEDTDRATDFANPINNPSEIYKLTLVSNDSAVLTLYMPANQVDENYWRETSKGFDYRNKTSFPDGIRSMKLSDGPAGRGGVKIAGGGFNLNLNVLNLADLKGTNVAVVLENDVACWAAIYPPETQNKKNNSRKFTAKVKN